LKRKQAHVSSVEKNAEEQKCEGSSSSKLSSNNGTNAPLGTWQTVTTVNGSPLLPYPPLGPVPFISSQITTEYSDEENRQYEMLERILVELSELKDDINELKRAVTKTR
jgi:hypothetical protein